MNTNIISHHLFVAALAKDRLAPDRQRALGRSLTADDLTGSVVVKPSPSMLAAFAARPWVNWPFAAVLEERSAS